MAAAGALVISRFRLYRIDLRQGVDADPLDHGRVAVDLCDRIYDALRHRRGGVAVSFKVLRHADRVNDSDLLQRVLQDDAGTQQADDDEEPVDYNLARPLERRKPSS